MSESLRVTPHILIIEARFYPEITEQLAQGAIAVLNSSQCTYERVQVSGALELPGAIRMAVKSMQLYSGEERFHGFIVLGSVIRGETSHYDHVSQEAIRGIQAVSLEFTLAVGNGILTTENKQQAMERSDPEKGNKGGVAAKTCLSMLSLKDRFGLLKE